MTIVFDENVITKETIISIVKNLIIKEVYEQVDERDLFGNTRKMKKSKNIYFSDMKKVFMDFFAEQYGEYSWRAKDSVAINDITKKLLKCTKKVII